jgi:hypothetical protein
VEMKASHMMHTLALKKVKTCKPLSTPPNAHMQKGEDGLRWHLWEQELYKTTWKQEINMVSNFHEFEMIHRWYAYLTILLFLFFSFGF